MRVIDQRLIDFCINIIFLEVLRLQEIESHKRKELLKEAHDWQNAKLIYEYVTHFDTLENCQIDEKFLEWKNSALNVANKLDPTSGILKRTIGKRSDFETRYL